MRCISPSDNGSSSNRRFDSNCTAFLRLVSIQVYWTTLVNRVKKNERLRLCLVPKDVNAAIQREHQVTPTLEEILPKFNGATVFSIVDAKCGYWNVLLDKGSNYLTTFNSPFGRYRFNGLPSGLKNVTRHLSNQN